MSENICSCPIIKQGDAYSVPVELYLNDTKLTGEHLPLLEEIEFSFDGIDPIRANAADAWDEEAGAFLLLLTQEQTFALEEGHGNLDIRVQFRNGNVIGLRKKVKINVADATSGEVL